MQNNKLDRVIEPLLEGIDTKQLWHIVFNKMTNPAKRQMLNELLNIILGTGYNGGPNNNLFLSPSQLKAQEQKQENTIDISEGYDKKAGKNIYDGSPRPADPEPQYTNIPLPDTNSSDQVVISAVIYHWLKEVIDKFEKYQSYSVLECQEKELARKALEATIQALTRVYKEGKEKPNGTR